MSDKELKPELFKLLEHNSSDQINFGNNDDTRKHLTVGKTYAGIKEVHSWHIKILIGDRKFNSACFEEIESRPPTPMVVVAIEKELQDMWFSLPYGPINAKIAGFIKTIAAKFGSPQKVHSCKCRTGQEGAMTVKRIDDGLYECPRCGGIIVPKPDPRFVEVGKIEWPEKMTSHLDSAFFEKEQKWLITDREQRAFGEGANYMRTACRAAVEKAKGQPHDAD